MSLPHDRAGASAVEGNRDSALWIRLFPIVLVLAVDLIGWNMMVSMLPFFAKRFGAKPLSIGLLFSTYSVFQLVASPILGALSDRYGRRRILLLSQLGSLLSFVVMFRASSFEALLVSRALDGLTAGNIPLALAYIVDVSKPHERTTALGQHVLANGLGLVIGAALAGTVSGIDARLPAMLAAICSALTIVSTYFLIKDVRGTAATVEVGRVATEPEKSKSKKKATALAILSWKTAPIIACLSFYHLIWGIYYTGIALYCAHRFPGQFAAKQSGFLYSFMGIFVIAFPVLVLPVMVKRLGDTKIVRVTFVTTALALCLLTTATSWFHVLAIIPLIHLGTIPLRPALVSIFSASVDKPRQGLALGLNQSLVAAGAILGPVIGGAIIGAGAVGWWPIAASVTALLGAVVSWIWIREQPRAAAISRSEVRSCPSDLQARQS